MIDVAPEGFLSVDFPSGESVCLGNHLNFYDTLLEPKLNWKAKRGKLYTIMMIDMDAPLPEKKELLSPFVHLLVVNVKGPSSWFPSSKPLLPTSTGVRNVVTDITRNQLWHIEDMARFVRLMQQPKVPKVPKAPIASPSGTVEKLPKVVKVQSDPHEMALDPYEMASDPYQMAFDSYEMASDSYQVALNPHTLAPVPVKEKVAPGSKKVILPPKNVASKSKDVSKTKVKPGEIKLSVKLPPALGAISEMLSKTPTLMAVHLKSLKPNVFKRWSPKELLKSRTKRSSAVVNIHAIKPKENARAVKPKSVQTKAKSKVQTKTKVQSKTKNEDKSEVPVLAPSLASSSASLSPIITKSLEALLLGRKNGLPGDLRGDYVLEYFQPTVPPKSEFHRMVLLVFEQAHKIKQVFAPPFNFNVKKFAKNHKLGNPIAGNYFFSKLYITRKVVC